jgi:hypothetical protein
MVDPCQLDTYTAVDTIYALAGKLITGYFWSGPKTLLFVASHVADSMHSYFRKFRCPKSHVYGQLPQTRFSNDALPPDFPQRRSGPQRSLVRERT